MVFHWSLSDSKSLQVSRTFFSILTVLNNAVVWRVSTRPRTSKSSSPFNRPLLTVLNAPMTISRIVTFVFHSYFLHSKVEVFILFYFLSVLFCGQPVQQRRQFCKTSFFLLITIRSDFRVQIRLSVCMSKYHSNLCVSFSRTAAVLYIYHLFLWSNLNFLHISQWITLPTQSFVVL